MLDCCLTSYGSVVSIASHTHSIRTWTRIPIWVWVYIYGYACVYLVDFSLTFSVYVVSDSSSSVQIQLISPSILLRWTMCSVSWYSNKKNKQCSALKMILTFWLVDGRHKIHKIEQTNIFDALESWIHRLICRSHNFNYYCLIFIDDYLLCSVLLLLLWLLLFRMNKTNDWIW